MNATEREFQESLPFTAHKLIVGYERVLPKLTPSVAGLGAQHSVSIEIRRKYDVGNIEENLEVHDDYTEPELMLMHYTTLTIVTTRALARYRKDHSLDAMLLAPEDRGIVQEEGQHWISANIDYLYRETNYHDESPAHYVDTPEAVKHAQSLLRRIRSIII